MNILFHCLNEIGDFMENRYNNSILQEHFISGLIKQKILVNNECPSNPGNYNTSKAFVAISPDNKFMKLDCYI